MAAPHEPFEIVQHDRLPIVEGQLLREQDGEPLNLAAGTTLASQVRFLQRASGAGALILNGQATILQATQGRVGYPWAAGETATPGLFQGRFRVHFAAGASVLQTVPNGPGDAGWIPILVATAVG